MIDGQHKAMNANKKKAERERDEERIKGKNKFCWM